MNGQLSYVLTPVRHFTPPDAPDDAALLADLRFVRGSEQVRDIGYFEYLDEMPPIDFTQSHADLGLFMPLSAATSFVGQALPRLTPEDLGGIQGIRMFFWKRTLFTRPLFRLPEEQLVCYTALLRSPTSDPEIARANAGGKSRAVRTQPQRRRHPVSVCGDRVDARGLAPPLRRAVARAIEQAKRRYDPDAVFASGPNLYFT